MAELLFPLADALQLAEHAVAAEKHTPVYTEIEAKIDNPTPGLHWAKDSGTYLMSNGEPGRTDLIVYATTAGGLLLKQPERYDENQEAWDDVWHTTREICGGDDFVEKIDLLTDDLIGKMRTAVKDDFTRLIFDVSETSFHLEFRKS